MTPVQKLAGLVVLAIALMGGTAGVTWQVQEWRMGKQLAEQAGLHQADLAEISRAAAAQAQAAQEKRLALEQQLTANDQTHHKELSDAQTNQDRLRDRLATADVRLSVLLDDSASCSPVLAASSASGMVHGRTRAQLDPAHAQRIIAITDAGDRGLIALRACQAYANQISRAAD